MRIQRTWILMTYSLYGTNSRRECSCSRNGGVMHGKECQKQFYHSWSITSERYNWLANISYTNDLKNNRSSCIMSKNQPDSPRVFQANIIANCGCFCFVFVFCFSNKPPSTHFSRFRTGGPSFWSFLLQFPAQAAWLAGMSSPVWAFQARLLEKHSSQR